MSLSPHCIARSMRPPAPGGTPSPPLIPRMAFTLPLAILLLLNGGCAFIDLKVAPPSAETLAQRSTLGRGREIHLQTPFADGRPVPERCGMQKNGYNMDTASVHCAVRPPVWLAQALEQGLSSAGFRVRTSPTPQNGSSVRVDGTVLQFFVEPDAGFFTFTPEADISVKLVVTSQSGLRAERVFYVKGIETSLAGTEENFQKAADSGTLQVVTAMVNAVAALLDKYPQLGAPAAHRTEAVSLLSGKEVQR